jgi:gamma-glutamylcyclotransferase (GGCT)/AIG2-like uncharacterized protein YtfP
MMTAMALIAAPVKINARIGNSFRERCPSKSCNNGFDRSNAARSCEGLSDKYIPGWCGDPAFERSDLRDVGAAPVIAAGMRQAPIDKMKVVTTLLFGYGTLMSTATGPLGRGQRQRLSGESSRLIGEGSARGRLYDLGRYPGLVECDDSTERVHGEVFDLLEPERTQLWLDAYEGIVPGDHPHNEYERCIRQITLTATGETVSAWVYIYRLDVTRARLIPDGRWV